MHSATLFLNDLYGQDWITKNVILRLLLILGNEKVYCNLNLIFKMS